MIPPIKCPRGALSSITVGTAVATLWWYLPLDANAMAPVDTVSGLWDLMKDDSNGWWSIQPATPGFLIATPVAIVVTLLTPAPARQMTELFDRVTSRADVWG